MVPIGNLLFQGVIFRCKLLVSGSAWNLSTLDRFQDGFWGDFGIATKVSNKKRKSPSFSSFSLSDVGFGMLLRNQTYRHPLKNGHEITLMFHDFIHSPQN